MPLECLRPTDSVAGTECRICAIAGCRMLLNEHGESLSLARPSYPPGHTRRKKQDLTPAYSGFAFSRASFSLMNARISSAIDSSLAHCSNAPLLADFEAHRASALALELLVLRLESLEFCFQVFCFRHFVSSIRCLTMHILGVTRAVSPIRQMQVSRIASTERLGPDGRRDDST